MKEFKLIKLQQWLQQAILIKDTNPLKLQGLHTTPTPDHPPSSYSWRWSGLGVVCGVVVGLVWCVDRRLVVSGEGGRWWCVVGGGCKGWG